MNVGITGDTANDLKEAAERAAWEREQRRRYLAKKYGKAGANEVLAQEQAKRG